MKHGILEGDQCNSHLDPALEVQCALEAPNSAAVGSHGVQGGVEHELVVAGAQVGGLQSCRGEMYAGRTTVQYTCSKFSARWGDT